MLVGGRYAPNQPPILAAQTANIGRSSRTGATAADLRSDGERATSWSITAGDSSGHFAISNAGKITVASAGQGNLSASYSLTVQATNANGSVSNTITVNTEANALDVTTGAELVAAVAYCRTTSQSTDWRVYVKDGYDLTDNAGSVVIQILAKNFSGTIADDGNSTADETTYDRNAVASISGGSCLITCRTKHGARISGGLQILASPGVCITNLLFTRRSDTARAGNFQSCLQFNNSGTAPSLHCSGYVRDCKFGLRGILADSEYWTQGIDCQAAETAIIEDCEFDGFWSAIFFRSVRRYASRRNIFTGYRNEDAMVSYLAVGAGLTPTLTRKRGEITDNVVMPWVDDGNFPLTHRDAIQMNTPGDTVNYDDFVMWNYLCSTQGYYMDGGGPGISHNSRVKFNFIMVESANGWVMGRAINGDTAAHAFNTLVKNTTNVDNFGNANSRVLIIPGGVAADRALSSNIIGAVWDWTTGAQGSVYASDGAIPNPMGDGASSINPSDNAYTSASTANTGGGTSYPEVFNGPFRDYLSNPGFKFDIVTDDGDTLREQADNFKASMDAIFAPKAGGIGEGKGHLSS